MDDFDNFLEAFGSRGPNEWETACETWGTNPTSVLTLIDRMRLTDPQNSPSVRALELSKKREATTSNARTELKGLGSWLFEKALHSSILFSQARERSKTTIVDLIHVARLITRELANRTAEQRDNAELIDLWFILESELDEFIEREIKPLERDNLQFFDYRRTSANRLGEWWEADQRMGSLASGDEETG